MTAGSMITDLQNGAIQSSDPVICIMPDGSKFSVTGVSRDGGNQDVDNGEPARAPAVHVLLAPIA